MLQAFRLQQGDATLSYPADEGRARRAGLQSPCRSGRRRDRPPAGGSAPSSAPATRAIEAVEASFAALARGRDSRSAARLRAVHRVRRPRARSRGRSSIPARQAMRSPSPSSRRRRRVRIRFFLKRGLGLRPVDEGERDKDVWLDPLTRGIGAARHLCGAPAPLPRRRPSAGPEEGRRLADEVARRMRSTG